MKKYLKNTKLFLLIVFSLHLVSLKVSAQEDALNFTSLGSGSNFQQGSYSLGWSFTTLQSVSVSALGFYDDLKNGLTQNHDVGIYDAHDCTLLASTTVRPSDPLSGFFRFRQITPVTLAADRTYYIAAVTGSEPYAIAVSSLQVSSSISFIGFSIFGNTQSTSTLQCPNGVQSPGFNGDFGPSFQIGGTGIADIVTPQTRLTEAPEVVVEERKVTLTFEDFSKASAGKKTRALGAKSNKALREMKAKKPKTNFTFEYAAEIKRTQDEQGKIIKNDIKNLTTKKNTLTVSSLQPGLFTVRYRVNIFSGKGATKKRVGQTRFSPKANFEIS